MDSLPVADPADVQLLSKIAKGGFATVFRGRWRGKPAAFKVVPFSSATDFDFCYRALHHECTTMGSIHHRNVVNALATVELPAESFRRVKGAEAPERSNGGLACIQELATAGSAAELLTKQEISVHRKLYRRADALAWSLDVCEALHALHTQPCPILHRDLKLENILLHKGHVKRTIAIVCDFGLSACIKNMRAYTAANRASKPVGHSPRAPPVGERVPVQPLSGLSSAPLSALPQPPTEDHRSTLPRSTFETASPAAVCEASVPMLDQDNFPASGTSGAGSTCNHSDQLTNLGLQKPGAYRTQRSNESLISLTESGISANCSDTGGDDDSLGPGNDCAPMPVIDPLNKPVLLGPSDELPAGGVFMRTPKRNLPALGTLPSAERLRHHWPGPRKLPPAGTGSSDVPQCPLAPPLAAYELLLQPVSGRTNPSEPPAGGNSLLLRSGSVKHQDMTGGDVAASEERGEIGPSHQGDKNVQCKPTLRTNDDGSMTMDQLLESGSGVWPAPPRPACSLLELDSHSVPAGALSSMPLAATAGAGEHSVVCGRAGERPRAGTLRRGSSAAVQGMRSVLRSVLRSTAQRSRSCSQLRSSNTERVSTRDSGRTGMSGPPADSRDAVSSLGWHSAGASQAPMALMRSHTSVRCKRKGALPRAMTEPVGQVVPVRLPHVCPYGSGEVAAWQLTRETGSYIYMAPEVVRGEPYNAKVDIYAMSLIIFQLFSGQNFSSHFESAEDLLSHARKVAMGRRPVMPASFPSALREIISAAWHADPNARPTAAQLRSMLQSFGASAAYAEYAGVLGHGRAWWHMKTTP